MFSVVTRLTRGLSRQAAHKRLLEPQREPIGRYVGVYDEFSRTEAAVSGYIRNLTTLGKRKGGLAPD